jgi:hypothetical protein
MPDRDGSIHEDFSRVTDEIQPGSNRTLGLIFAAFFLLVGITPLLHGHLIRWWALVVAAAFLAAALVMPKILRPLNMLWTKLGMMMQRITSPVFTTLLYFVAIVPIGLLMRLVGRDPLGLQFDREAKSYWLDRTPTGRGPESMKDQF